MIKKPNISTMTSFVTSSSAAYHKSGCGPTIISGSGATPILYGRFPRRFCIRTRPNVMRYLHHLQQLEPVPSAYRPRSGIPTHPDVVSEKMRLTRLRRPTTASKCDFRQRQTQVTCHYAWSNLGIATFRDTAKCVYDVYKSALFGC